MYNLSNNSSENRLFSWALASQPFMGDSSENVLFHTGWCTTYMTVYSEHGVFIVGGGAPYMRVFSDSFAAYSNTHQMCLISSKCVCRL